MCALKACAVEIKDYKQFFIALLIVNKQYTI